MTSSVTSGRGARVVATTIAASLLVLSFAGAARADEPVADPPPPLAPLPEGAPAPAPAIVEQEPVKDEPRKRKEVGLAGRVQGGFGQRRLFDASVTGADLTGSLGLYIDNVNLYFDIQLFFGSTEGLPVRLYRFGPSVDVEVFSRFRLGAGLALGSTQITRETTGSATSAFSVGGRVFASVDVLKTSERGAIYVLGQLSLDSAGSFLAGDERRGVPATYLWGPTLAGGFRF